MGTARTPGTAADPSSLPTALAPDCNALPRGFLPAIAAAVFVTTLTGSMLNVLLPLIRADFGASTAHVGWVVTGYALAYAVGVPLCGRLSDAFGIRRVFVAGLLGFAGGGLACALAPNLPLLVAGRTLQGIGGAAIPALAGVAVAQVLPPGRRGGALGVVASAVGVGSATGPIVGGAVAGMLGWRSLFVSSLVLALLAAPLARRALPAIRRAKRQPIDVAGGALLGLAAGSALFALTQIQAGSNVAATASSAVAVVAGAGFAWRIRTAPLPFAPPALFRNRVYLAALAAGFFAMLANLGALVAAPLLLVEGNGVSPTAAGFVLMPGAVALALLSPATGRLSDRLGARTLLRIGLAVMAVALAGLSTAGAGGLPAVVGLGMLALGCGFALVQPSANNAAANALPLSDVGAGMGLFAGAFFLGGGTGAALVGVVIAAGQHAGRDAINPFHVLDAAPFSDAFLVLAGAAVTGIVAASFLVRPEEHPGRRATGTARVPATGGRRA